MATNAASLNDIGGDALKGQLYVAPDLAEAAAKDPIVSNMRGTHDFLRKGFDAIQNALRTQDPTRTAEAHFMEVKKKAEQWLSDGARKAEATRTAAEAAIAAIEQEIVEELGIADGKYASEIRAHFLQMPKNDRINAIRAAIEKRDAETLGALLSGPSFLSGFSDDEQALFRRLYAEKYAAKPLARKAAIEKSVDINRRTFDEALMAVSAMFPHGKVADISARIEKAQAAKDGILAS